MWGEGTGSFILQMGPLELLSIPQRRAERVERGQRTLLRVGPGGLWLGELQSAVSVAVVLSPSVTLFSASQFKHGLDRKKLLPLNPAENFAR